MFWTTLGQYTNENVATAHAASQAQTRAAGLADDVKQLSRQVERLTLVSQALWELLRETGAFQEEQLLARMEEIDLRDGEADGKIRPTRLTCPKCNRVNNSKRGSCMYCGQDFLREHVFEG